MLRPRERSVIGSWILNTRAIKILRRELGGCAGGNVLAIRSIPPRGQLISSFDLNWEKILSARTEKEETRRREARECRIGKSTGSRNPTAQPLSECEPRHLVKITILSSKRRRGSYVKSRRASAPSQCMSKCDLDSGSALVPAILEGNFARKLRHENAVGCSRGIGARSTADRQSRARALLR